MLARIWKAAIEEDRKDEYLQFIHSCCIPMFRKQQGILGVQVLNQQIFSTVITLWHSKADIEQMETNGDYLGCVEEISKAGFLNGEESIEIFDLYDGFLKLNGYMFDIPKLQRPATIYNQVIEEFMLKR